MSVKTFKDLILLCKIAAAGVFVMIGDNLIYEKARIIHCRKFSSLQTSLLFLRLLGFWFCFLTCLRSLIGILKGILIGFGSTLHRHNEVLIVSWTTVKCKQAKKFLSGRSYHVVRLEMDVKHQRKPLTR